MAQPVLVRMGGNDTLIRDLQLDKGHLLISELLTEAGYKGVLSLIVAEAERGSSSSKGIVVGICRFNRLEIHVQPGDNGTRKLCRLTPPEGESCEGFRGKLLEAQARLSKRARHTPAPAKTSVPERKETPPVIVVSKADSPAQTPTPVFPKNWSSIGKFLGDCDGLGLFLVDFLDRFSGDWVSGRELAGFAVEFTKLPQNRIASLYRFLTAREIIEKVGDGYGFSREKIRNAIRLAEKTGSFPKSTGVKRKKSSEIIHQKDADQGVDVSIEAIDKLSLVLGEITSIGEEIFSTEKKIAEISRRESETTEMLQAIRAEKTKMKKCLEGLFSKKRAVLRKNNLTPRNLRLLEKILGKK